MLDAQAPIGILDAGIGGFTTVKELQNVLPGERIVYFGDGKNQPYGNRSQEEILHLTRQGLAFLQEQGVKAVGVACNTISTIIDQLEGEFPFPIFSIVHACCDMVAGMELDRVGVIATVFTVSTGCYEHLIHESLPYCRVTSEGSRDLARLIEQGDFPQKEIDDEITLVLDHLLERDPEVRVLVLGCTHYPLVAENIDRLYKGRFRQINPASVQAVQLSTYLEENGLLNQDDQGGLVIYTTSDPNTYRSVAKTMGLKEPDHISLVPAPELLCKA